MAISIFVISAICGNFWQESTLNPAIWQSLHEATFETLNVGYGLGQWTNTGGDTQGRLFQLHEYLVNNGYDIDSGEGQLEYLLEEGTWYSTQEASMFRTLDDFLNSDSTDLVMLTHAFNRGWEGIHDSSWDIRVAYANKCYTYIQQHAKDPNITTWASGNRYLPEQERLNNAVLIYRYLDGYYKRKKGMPVWMMLRRF